MKDQELFAQLHKLSTFGADASFKAKQRAVMLKQIGFEAEEAQKRGFAWDFSQLAMSFATGLPQSLVVASVAAFLFLTGGFVSLRTAQDAQPGDSLYQAKLLSEKARFAMAISEKKKAELGLQFAVKRAEEIQQIMVQGGDEAKDDEQVEQLVNDFKKELDAAKTRIAKISAAVPSVDNKQTENKPENIEAPLVETKAESPVQPDNQVFSAGSGRDDKGLSVAEQKDSSTQKNIASTTTPKASTPVQTTQNPGQMIEEATALLKADDYKAAAEMLEKAGPVIDQNFGGGEVKGVEESVGTSTVK